MVPAGATKGGRLRYTRDVGDCPEEGAQMTRTIVVAVFAAVAAALAPSAFAKAPPLRLDGVGLGVALTDLARLRPDVAVAQRDRDEVRFAPAKGTAAAPLWARLSSDAPDAELTEVVLAVPTPPEKLAAVLGPAAGTISMSGLPNALLWHDRAAGISAVALPRSGGGSTVRIFADSWATGVPPLDYRGSFDPFDDCWPGDVASIGCDFFYWTHMACEPGYGCFWGVYERASDPYGLHRPPWDRALDYPDGVPTAGAPQRRAEERRRPLPPDGRIPAASRRFDAGGARRAAPAGDGRAALPSRHGGGRDGRAATGASPAPAAPPNTRLHPQAPPAPTPSPAPQAPRDDSGPRFQPTPPPAPAPRGEEGGARARPDLR